MGTLSQTLQKNKQVRDLVIAGFGGLSIYSDSALRTKETWQTLDNFDLVVDGAIRKVLPAKLIAGPFSNVLYQLLEYRTGINFQGGRLRLLAIDALGNLWDVNGAAATPWSASLTATLSGGLLDIPFLGQMQGYYIPFVIKTWLKSTAYNLNDAVYRYSASDGNLYVYKVSSAGTTAATEPKWPAAQGSTVVDNGVTWTNAGVLNSQRFKLNYGIVVSKSFPALKFVEWKYDPTNAAETAQITGNRIGVTAPLNPINVTAALTTPNNNGYGPVSGRAYVWTYYNPNTLHDSSPAPFVGKTKYTNLDNAGAQTELNGSLLPPLAQPVKGFTTYQAVYLEIPSSALTPTYGDGYSCIRCWATKDGGTTFFLLSQLYDSSGVLLTNGDGSIPVATLQTQSNSGFVPLPTPQNAQATVRIYDGNGAGVVNLVPDPQNLGPGSWTATRGTGIIVVPNDSPTGQAAFEFAGTGAAATNNIYKSAQIKVSAGQIYAFSGYIDKTAGTGGTVEWVVINFSGGGALLNKAQADGTAGTLTGTFTAPASGQVQIEAHIVTTTVTDGGIIEWGDPQLQKGASIATTPIVYPTQDSSLTIPAPASLSQNPPPANCLTGIIFENTLFLVDYNDPSRLWYSNNGDFNSYGVNAFLQFPTDRSFSIMELIAAYDRLLVSSGRAIDQVLANSPNPGFARFPFDPQHGSLSYRGSLAYGSSVLALMDPGLAQLHLHASLKANQLQTGFTPEAVISRPIKPLLDGIDPKTVHLDSNVPGEPIATVDNKQDLYLLGYRANPSSAYMDTLVAMPLRGAGVGQFSRLPTLPGNGQVVNLKEVQLSGGGAYGVLALTGDKKVYQLFAGTQDGTITATATTQLLPTAADIEPELWDTEKVAQELIIEGVDLTNFQISVSADGGATFPYGPFTVVDSQHLIRLGAISARQFTFKFVHTALTTNTPDLSMIKLSYDVLGKQP